MMLRAIRASGGLAVAVEEEKLADAVERLARQEGQWVGPEGAACFVALEKLAEERTSDDSRFEIIRLSRQGIVATLNEGIRRSAAPLHPAGTQRRCGRERWAAAG